MIPAFLLIIAAVSYRIGAGLAIISGTTWLSNFAPMAAIALCGAVYFRGHYKFTVPLVALLISDLVLNLRYEAPLLDPLILCRYFALSLVGMVGLFVAKHPSLNRLLVGSLAGSVVFYIVTNVFSWLTDPGYAKDLAGMLQALTVGLPQHSATPTWMFFRNSVVSDLFFTVLFFFCMKFARSPDSTRAASALPRPA